MGSAPVASDLRGYEDGADPFDRDGYPVAWQQIKHWVREDAEHRCVRCYHPYVCGESKAAWSPCDGRCEHGGPVRLVNQKTGAIVHGPTEPNPGECLEPILGVEVQAAWRVLTVHHLDGDKANCRWWNLTALCQRCHLEIQGKVRMERRWLHEHSDWFKPYVAGYYAFRFLGEDLARSDVEARLEELLALEERQLLLAQPEADSAEGSEPLADILKAHGRIRPGAAGKGD